MGDEVVDTVHSSWREISLANGVDHPNTHPIADFVVNKLRKVGFSDSVIESWFWEKD